MSSTIQRSTVYNKNLERLHKLQEPSGARLYLSLSLSLSLSFYLRCLSSCLGEDEEEGEIVEEEEARVNEDQDVDIMNGHEGGEEAGGEHEIEHVEPVDEAAESGGSIEGEIETLQLLVNSLRKRKFLSLCSAHAAEVPIISVFNVYM